MEKRISKIVDFLQEIDQLKHVKRRSHVSKEKRPETVAEHSWHLAMFAILLRKELQVDISLERTLELVAVHDLVEIYAGDTFAFDEEGHIDKQEREERAADKLFGILPPDLQAEMQALWEEFETGTSPEAVFARSLDKLQAVNQNICSQGYVWLHYDIPFEKVEARNQEGVAFDPAIRELFETLKDRAITQGYFPDKDLS